MVYPDFFVLFTNLFYFFIFLNKIQINTHIKKIKNTTMCTMCTNDVQYSNENSRYVHYNYNQLYNNKNIKTPQQQKCTANRELQQAIKTKNNVELELKNNQYRIIQENLEKINIDYETEAAQKKLKNIIKNGG